MRLAWHVHMFLISVIACGQSPTPQPNRPDRATGPVGEKPLVPPMLLQKEALEAGNPLATYAAMLDLERQYRNSKAFAGIYAEVRLFHAVLIVYGKLFGGFDGRFQTFGCILL